MYEVVHLESGFGGLTNNNIYWRVVHIKYKSSESTQLIYIGGLYHDVARSRIAIQHTELRYALHSARSTAAIRPATGCDTIATRPA